VDRGDMVKAGDVLVQLDATVLQSQWSEAKAALAAARANLDGVTAGAPPDEITVARAALAQAETQRDGAEQAVIYAQDAITNPLSLNAEIDEARTQARLAAQNLEMAKANLQETQLWQGLYVGDGGDTERVWNLQLLASQSALGQAEAVLGGAQRYLNALTEIRAKPLELEAQLHAADMNYDLSQAQVATTQARLNELEAGPTDEEVAVAQATVHQAQASVQLVDVEIAQLTLTAPIDGVVTNRNTHQGETVAAGYPLLTIANLEEVRLVIYVPEDQVGRIRIGQEVEVRVDSFPDRAFEGQVLSIGGKAEFTPRNVQTQEERVNLVFAVKMSIPNLDSALKPGMPADATLRP